MSLASPTPAAATAAAADGRPRPLVAVDLDEVLGAFVEALAAWHNVTHGTGACARVWAWVWVCGCGVWGGVQGALSTLTPSSPSPSLPPPPPPAALTPDAFHSYHFSEVWGGTDDEARLKMDAFFASTHFDRVAPLSDAARTLRALTPFFRFVVVTSRQHVLEGRTRGWLARHFPGVFEDCVFGNHYGDGPKL